MGTTVFRKANPSAPGQACVKVTTSSYLSSEPRPDRPTIKAAYFSRDGLAGLEQLILSLVHLLAS